MMEAQQVNVQELQRLNDAITMTMEAIRRVAPQLGGGIFGGAQYGQYGQPWGGVHLDPITQAYAQGQAHALRQILSTVGGVGVPQFTQPQFTQPQFTTPWTQPQFVPPWTQSYGMPWQHQLTTPYLNLQQRPF